MLAQNGKAIAADCADPGEGNSTCTINGEAGIGEQLTALNSVVSLLIGGVVGSGSANKSNGSGTAPVKSEAVREVGNVGLSQNLALVSILMVVFYSL